MTLKPQKTSSTSKIESSGNGGESRGTIAKIRKRTPIIDQRIAIVEVAETAVTIGSLEKIIIDQCRLAYAIGSWR